MTTIVNNPNGGDSSGMGWVVGLVVALIVIFLFFVYALPAIRNANSGGTKTPGTINVQVTPPSNNSGTTKY